MKARLFDKIKSVVAPHRVDSSSTESPTINSNPKLVSKSRQKDRYPGNKPPDKWTLELLQDIEWKLFEDICAAYLDSKGWHVKQTEIGPDGGVDIFFNSKNWEKETPFGIVQCKARANWHVPVSSIRELFGVMAAEEAEIGIFITTGKYSPAAHEFALGKRLQLVDGAGFLGLMQALDPNVQIGLLKKHLSRDYANPTCPRCGEKMVERVTKKGKNVGKKFWGCSQFPACRSTMPMKSKK